LERVEVGLGTKGYEGLFFEPTRNNLPSILFVEVSAERISNVNTERSIMSTCLSPSKEEGSGASDILSVLKGNG